MAKLTVLQIRAAKPKTKPYKLADGQGLYFHVATSGKRTWRYRYKIAGTEFTFTLGEYPLLSLEQARIARMEAREIVKDGKNPAHERRAERETTIKKNRLQNKLKKIPLSLSLWSGSSCNENDGANLMQMPFLQLSRQMLSPFLAAFPLIR